VRRAIHSSTLPRYQHTQHNVYNISEAVPHTQRTFRELQELVDIRDVHQDIAQSLYSDNMNLNNAAYHLFQGGGKFFRPTTVLLMACACNTSHHASHNQTQIAVISEMIHVASLMHDDIIDEACQRRNAATVNNKWNDKVAVLGGDYVIAKATEKLAKIGCTETITILSRVIRDLIRGEILQLKNSMTHEELFDHYINKTFLKTASLLAHSCQAVTLLSDTPHLQHQAYEYGKNLGIAFQLVDDMLDFVSTDSSMGKPTGADLELGLATAPVLYAAQEHPELNALINRRFKQPGDSLRALEFVNDSAGIEKTRELAQRYCDKAVESLDEFSGSQWKEGLVGVTDVVLSRDS